jgi:hypothetical protein
LLPLFFISSEKDSLQLMLGWLLFNVIIKKWTSLKNSLINN